YINVVADTVELRNGGQLLTNAFSSGNAGDIHLNASQQVLITGTNANPGTAPPPVPRAIVTTRNQGSLAEVEPNDSLAEAMVLRNDLFSLSTADAAIPDISLSDRLPYVSLAATGSNPATSDYYSFEVVAGTRGFFDIDNGVNGDDPNDPGNVDLAISLFDSNGNLLKTSIREGRASTLQGAGGSTDINDPYLQFTFRESGTFFLKVTRDVNIDQVIDDTPNVRIPAPSTYTLQVSLGNPNFAGNVVNTSSASGLFAQTEGAGTAGDVTINTPQLTIEDQGLVAATTAVTGSAGTISIEANDSVVLNQGSISTAVEQGAILPNTAVASNIEIDTKELNLTNDSNISTATAGIGDAGDVRIINSDRIFIDNSKVSSAVESSGVGTGGNIRFNTNNLSLANNATVSSATAGTGGAGEVEIHASDRISINNSTVSSAVESSGMGTGGNIRFNTNDFSLADNATVSSATAGMGNAGEVEIHASDRISINNSTVSSAVESSGMGAGGNILFNTNNFSLDNKGTVSSATAGTGDAGGVEIHASDRISINNSTVSSAVESSGMGAGGNIRFNTNNFSVVNHGTVSSATAGMGNAGEVEIHASDRISINNSTVSSAVESSGMGAGGNIRFNTNNFSVANNGTVSSATAGMGNAGEVEIHTSDRISIDNNSTVSSAVNPTGVGTGGRINLQSPTVEVTNGARVSTSTEGQGAAGIIDVTANRFLATNGGQLLSTTSSNSNAGNIELNVIDDITLTGAGTGLFANSTPGSTGDGGSIIIDPITMTIEDGAGIAVDSQGAGIGGEIHISAGSLTLDQGFITAEAFSDQGGDINLDIADILLLRNHSLISATAGIGSGAGDGGNINIGAQFVIGVPNENSDIIANAFLGDGGRIEITTNAIFGLKFREEVTPSSDITASSEFGTDGIFIFNRLSFDATQGLNELPGVFVDAASLIGKDACALIDGKIGGGSSLIIIGKGGLPPNPGELLSNNNALVEWATHEPSNQRPAVVVSQQPTDSTGTPIYPEMRQAQGWIINPDGTVILTAEPQRVTPYNPGLRHPGC
ncbi:MAG: S-layer family protein, partial [Symploca sp. SIO1A3]|nr:S-layer family protein [Symploca sp. SIO1A3]